MNETLNEGWIDPLIEIQIKFPVSIAQVVMLKFAD